MQENQEQPEDIGDRNVDSSDCFTLAVAKVAALMAAGALSVPESIRRDEVRRGA